MARTLEIGDLFVIISPSHPVPGGQDSGNMSYLWLYVLLILSLMVRTLKIQVILHVFFYYMILFTSYVLSILSLVARTLEIGAFLLPLYLNFLVYTGFHRILLTKKQIRLAPSHREIN